MYKEHQTVSKTTLINYVRENGAHDQQNPRLPNIKTNISTSLLLPTEVRTNGFGSFRSVKLCLIKEYNLMEALVVIKVQKSYKC